MQQQALESQAKQIQDTQSQINKAQGQKFNKTAAIAGALGSLVSPNSNAFNTVMSVEQGKKKNLSNLQNQLAGQNKNLSSMAYAMGAGDRKKEMADYNYNLANKMAAGAEARKKEMTDYNHALAMKRIMANKASNTPSESNRKFTPGERALDTKFAKENSNFYDTVLPGLNSNLDNLKKVTKMLGTPR